MLLHYNKPIIALSAPCGAGKTHTLGSYANGCVMNGEYVIIVVPSTDLADQYETDLKKRFIFMPVFVFHKDLCVDDEK